ncbi:MAG: PhoH family protein, partial [Spirochaetales bacterium]|nr:PhoH family protein [Spirochaetales bacterium]
LPGDFSQKINPYLIPLFDAINSLISQEINVKLTNQNLIEIAPLAYMRGRTFSDAIVILDEAQNTTNTQMKMFLTRLGDHGKLIISGDISQTDLPRKVPSGMATALNIFAKENIDEIGIVEFCDEDVVRHPVVRKIINAYTKYEKKENDNGKEKN